MPEESIVAAGTPAPGAPAAAIGRAGRRWGYLSVYDSPTQRSARFGPFPFGACGGEYRTSVTLLPFGTQGWSATFRDCPAGVDPVWLLLPGGEVLSLSPARSGALTRWAGSAPAAALIEEIAARWAAAPPRDVQLQPLPATAIDLADAPAVPPLDAAHAEALRRWRNTRGPAAQRAAAAIAALGPLPDRTDWFGADAPPVAIVNDMAFWLQQTGGCAEAGQAAALLGAVLRRDPARTPARLNRADAMATRLACARDASATAMREEYRLYCTALPPSRLPAPIARRIAARLDVPALDAESCRPRFGAHHAIAAGDLAALQALLIEHPEDAMEADGRGTLPLGHAVARRDHAAAAALLRAGADADRAGLSEHTVLPLVSAAWNGDVEMVRLLLARRARVDPVNPRVLPLHAAAQAARQHGGAVAIALLTLMLDARAPVDGTDQEGRTALMEAAGAAAPPEVIALLIGRGARINRVNRYGRNAAHAVPPFTPAAAETLDTLIAAGANLNQQTHDGMTPLNHLFAWTGRDAAVVRLLAARMLAAGTDPRLPDNERRSALFRAAVSGDAELVALMLSVPPRGTAPAQEDPIPIIRRRIAEAQARPAPPGCPCAADWRRVLELLGAP